MQGYLPLRRWMPLGRLAGPTEKPFLDFLAGGSGGACSASAVVLLGAMVGKERIKRRWMVREAGEQSQCASKFTQ